MSVSQWFLERRRSASLLFVAVFCLLSAAAPASAQLVSQITIPLGEYKGSGVSGLATLSVIGNYVEVSMTLSGEQIAGEHPSHIHTGTCENFDPNPIFPLTTVVLGSVDDLGQSRTLVTDVSLRELLADDYVILVHKSADELTNYFVCGEISGEIVASVPAGEDRDGAVSVAEVEVAEGAGSETSEHSGDEKNTGGGKTRQVGQQRISKVPAAGSGDQNIVAGSGNHLVISFGAVALALGGFVVTRRTSRNAFSADMRR